MYIVLSPIAYALYYLFVLFFKLLVWTAVLAFYVLKGTLWCVKRLMALLWNKTAEYTPAILTLLSIYGKKLYVKFNSKKSLRAPFTYLKK